MVFFIYAIYRYYRLQNLRQKQLIEAIIQTQEEERLRISQELHDNLGSALSGVGIEISYLQKNTSKEDKANANLAYLSDYHKRATAALKSSIKNLSPFQAEKTALLTALELLLNDLKHHAIEVHLNVQGEPVQFNENASLNLYRLFQELCNNTIKHAKAKEVFISLHYMENIFEIIYEDDGIGFNTEEKNKGFGLSSIATRTEVLKGIKQLESKENYGTKWIFKFDLKQIT